MAINIQNVGIPLDDKYTQLAIKHGIQYKVPPSLFICQWWYESNFGTSPVAKDNNNWGGSTWSNNKVTKLKRPSGVIAYRGTPRPKNEGLYYMRFNTVGDYMIDYFYLLLNQGVYNVKGHNDWNKSVAGLFRAGGSTRDYAAAGYTRYNDMMRGIRAGINKRNNNILDKIDKDPEAYLDGKVPKPEPSDPIIVPPPDPSDPLPPNITENFHDYIGKMFDKINDFLTIDLYDYDLGKHSFGNEYVTLIKQFDNMYKIKPTLSLENTFKKIIQDGLWDLDITLDGILRPDKPLEPQPDPDPDPPEPPPTDPNVKKYFPVKYSSKGVNFWKKSNWKMGQLQYAMCYGYTRNGGKRFHSAYDIGAGGRTGLGVYATTEGTVQFVRYSNSGGFMIQIKHSTDEYYSTYMHLVNKSNYVKAGDKVKAGQRIATMGQTPGNVAIHLHYVLSKDGSTNGVNSTFDPEPYLKITGDNKTSLPEP